MSFIISRLPSKCDVFHILVSRLKSSAVLKSLRYLPQTRQSLPVSFPHAHYLTWLCCKTCLVKVEWQWTFFSWLIIVIHFQVIITININCITFTHLIDLIGQQVSLNFLVLLFLAKLIPNCSVTQKLWYNTAVVIHKCGFTEFHRQLHSSAALSALLVTSTSFQMFWFWNSECTEKIIPRLVKTQLSIW